MKNGSSDVPAARALHEHLLEFGRHPSDGRVIANGAVVIADDTLSPCDYCMALTDEVLIAGGRRLAE